jgi:hypothetical protein
VTTAVFVACFLVDVTPPIGHPLCGGLVKPVERVADPLGARGFVLLGGGKPIVYCAVDWCEIHNDAYDRWRTVLAEAAGTTPDRVVVATLHQHDAPMADLTARRLLDDRKVSGSMCDPEFHDQAVRRVAAAIREAIRSPRKITHVGLGQAKVDKMASNRRVVGPDGKVHDMRHSACTNPALRAAPEGLIDPWLKTLSFWDGDRPVLAMSCYATHPMSYYRTGAASSDVFGLARARRQADDPAVFQVMFNGCAGNIAAGKYNDGSAAMRPILTERVYQAMAAAWTDTKTRRLGPIAWRVEPLALPARQGPGWTADDLAAKLDREKSIVEQVRLATALSWIRRVDAGRRIDVPVLDLGVAQIVLLPGEPFVEYQLAAQKMRPDSFVMVLGYGDIGPGYVPVDQAFGEGGYESGDWSFVRQGVEPVVMDVLRKALRQGPGPEGAAK